jgi:hypothetical protein
MWDSGWDVKLGDDINGFVAEGTSGVSFESALPSAGWIVRP